MGFGGRFQEIINKKPAFAGNLRLQRLILASIFFLLILSILYLAFMSARVDLDRKSVV